MLSGITFDVIYKMNCEGELTLCCNTVTKIIIYVKQKTFPTHRFNSLDYNLEYLVDITLDRAKPLPSQYNVKFSYNLGKNKELKTYLS